MGDYDDLKPLWLEAHQSARDQLILQARLGRGDADKTLFVSNKPGYCWARIFAPEGVTQEMIRCRKVTAAYGAMVDVQRGRDGVYEAIGEASTDAAQAYWGDLGNGNVPRHGATHSLNGVDPVFLSAKQYKPLDTIPDTPASASVYVNPAWYIDTDGERQYFAGDTADLSSEIAALLPDEQQLVVIALDRSTGTLTKTAGTAENIPVSNVYGMPFEVADVTAITLADNLIPSQAVRIREGQTTIQLYDMPEAFDMRVWHGGQLSTGALTIEDALFTLQDDGDPTKQLQFQLSGITAGQIRTLTVPDLSDTIVTLTATQTLTNKTLTSPAINTPVIIGGTIDNAVIGGTTPAAGTFTEVNILRTSAEAALVIRANAGQYRTISFQSVGATPKRWEVRAENAAESGSNTGSDLGFYPHDDSGVERNRALLISRASGQLTSEVKTALTNSTLIAFNQRHITTGTPAAGFGIQQLWQGHASTNVSRNMGDLLITWVTATDASRAARIQLRVGDAATLREGLRIESSGTAPMIGFLGATAIARYNATGTVTGFTAGAGTAVNDDSTFTGNTGATAYTIGDVVRAMKQYGLLTA